MSFNIQGPQTIENVEVELRRVLQERPVTITLPKKPTHWWFGGEAALAQLLITWSRRVPNSSLRTYAGDPSKIIHGLASRMFGFVGLMMARDVSDHEVSCFRWNWNFPPVGLVYPEQIGRAHV